MNTPKSEKRLVCTGLFYIKKREKIIDKESSMLYNIIINKLEEIGER